MIVLVGCEESQAVTIALRERGHEAYSCDILSCSGGFPQWHLPMDVFEAVKGGTLMTQAGTTTHVEKWDMGIFFPDCTFITVSGLHWNKRGVMVNGVPRAEKTEDALQFVADLMNAPIEKKAIENPIGCISTRLSYIEGKYVVTPLRGKGKGLKPTQIIQPYNFGEDASKATCLWLQNIPKLQNTGYFPPRITSDGKKRWGNQTDSGQNKLGPSEDRAKMRAKTYRGVAEAIADQWTSIS